MLSKLTMIGLHKYSDGHLWDNVVLPEGMDASIFIGECLRQGGEFPVLYADLDFMKMQIGEFCKKWSKTFDRWWKAYNFEYEALFNLDVTSTRTEVGNNSGEVHSNGRSNDSSTINKAAYDSSQFQPTQQIVNGGTNGVDSNNSSKHDVTTTEVRQGNQGVTMSQEMLLAEYNAWTYNIYSHMAEIFVNEMCICIYI